MYRNLGILGGTFNPIHNGHIALAKQACEHFNLHRVFLIPSGIPPHKNRKKVISAKDRYRMTCLAAEKEEFLSVLDIEINRKGKAYTVDTLKEIKDNSADNLKIIYIIGSDIIFEILTWKEPRKIFKMCELALFERPGYINMELDKKIKILENEYGAIIHRVKMEPVDIASSNIRRMVEEGLDISKLVPTAVEDFIYENRLYGAKNRQKENRIERMKNVLKGSISINRYNHSLNVMKIAEKLAKKWGANIEEAQTAGLLHDCGKTLKSSQLLKICNEKGIEVDKVMRMYPEALLHALVGRFIANEKYGVKNEEILEAIESHTLGSSKMQLLSKIIFISDYIEEGRTFKGVEELRELAFKDLDAAIIKALDGTIKIRFNDGELVHDRAIQTRNELIIESDIHKNTSE